MTETVLTALADGVLVLTLNRPEKLNAFNVDLHLALRPCCIAPMTMRGCAPCC